LWFNFDKNALTVDQTTIVVQVNGKVRAKLNLPYNAKELEVQKAALSDTNVLAHTDGKKIVKEIYVKNKIYNIVVK
jgi:leucyl-tRNA synthetase